MTDKCSIQEKRNLLKKMDNLLQEMENQRKAELEQLQSIQNSKCDIDESNLQPNSVFTFGNFDEHSFHRGGATLSGCTSVGLKFHDIISAFKPFKSDNKQNIRSWVENFEQQCSEFGFSRIQTFIFAKRLMADNAKLFIEFESRASSCSTLKPELIDEFDNRINSSLVHQRLKKRKKKTN